MKRYISKLITFSFITIISISIVFFFKKIKKTKNIFNYIRIKYKKFVFNIKFFIPYLKNKNDKIEKEMGI